MGMLVYLVTNLIDGKMYVGKTEKTVQRRWKEHLANARNPKHQEYFYRAIRGHKPENFRAEELAEAASPEALNELEKLWILALGTAAPNGYNMTSGGDGVAGTPEVCEKIRAKALGRPASERQKAVASLTHRGKPKPAAQREKMAASWDDERREAQARVARAVNKAENARLRDYECPDCGTRFEQVTKGVYCGHRRWCLNYREQ
jgi:group I intron endonuclease